MNPCPKIKPVRSEPYKKHIRSQLCLACGSHENIVAAHQPLGYGCKADKVSDIQTVPLCSSPIGEGGCHEKEHRGHLSFWRNFLWLPLGEKERMNGWLAMRMIEYLNEFIAGGGKF